ncbi:cytochrome P450 6k1-like [Venturia canescens]|uniref:cytochrome P450 6k1-like n=1 Tax=Venturia canescens TaxID=32260 RepID=UPI001C9CF55E|nr:cytochrome P450 6k1-like [Venturia canescens]
MAFVSSVLVMKILGTILVIFAGFHVFFKYFLYNYWKKRGVVYVESAAPAGIFWPVVMGKTCIGELYADLYTQQKNNRYFGTYAFYKPSLVVSDPDLIRQVLTKNFNHFHDRGLYCNEKVDPLSGHLFLLGGTKWRNLRVKLTPTFTSGKMKQMFTTVVETGEKLSDYLKPLAAKREVVEVKDVYARFGTDVIMSIAFGVNSNSLKTPNSEIRFWGQKVFEPQPFWNTISLFAPKVMDFFSIPFTDRGVIKFFLKTFTETIEYREANNVVRPDFMNLIMQLMNRGYVDPDADDDASNTVERSYEKITTTEGVAQAYVFFLAGFETTSTTITYCLYELAINQDIQDKVMKDIDIALEKFGGITYESILSMTYLHKAVSETMRKYPPVPMLNRVCTKDIDLPTTSLHISKGVDVVIPVLGLHRDPEIYPDPNKFDPERFNEENIASRHPYTYLPFGEGPRICIGMRFGYAQTKVGLICTLSKYRVRLAPNTPVPLEFDPGVPVLTARGGIELIIEPR